MILMPYQPLSDCKWFIRYPFLHVQVLLQVKSLVWYGEADSYKDGITVVASPLLLIRR